MKTNAIICPSCRTAVHWDAPIDPVVFGCAHCHKVFDVNESGTYTEQPAMPKQISRVKPDWFVPGAKVHINDVKYTVISIYCNGVNWQEWDSEAGWESGYGEYLEWFLVSENGKREMWLEESDNDNYLNINQEVKIEQDHIAKINSTHDVPSQVKEVGRYSTIAFQGTDDEPVDRSFWNYKKIQGSTGPVSVEWQDNTPPETWRAYRSNNQVRKLDLDRGRERSPEDLEHFQSQTKELGFLRDIFLGATLVMLGLMIFSFIGSNREPVLKHSWRFSQTQLGISTPKHFGQFGQDTTLTKQLPLSQPSKEQFNHEFGTVRLQPGTAYRFSADCAFDESNADADFTISMLKMPEGKPVNAIGATFFSETGTDSDGAWTEATLSDYFQFTVEEEGEYLIEAQLLPQDRTGIGQSGLLSVSIRPVMLSRYFIIFFLAVTLCWLILQWRWEYMAIQSGSDASGWFLRLFGK